MKIGIDTCGLNHGRSGIGSYLTSVLSNLPDFGSDVSIELFGNEIDRYAFGNEGNFTFRSFLNFEGSLFERLWHFFVMPVFVKQFKYDMVFYRVGLNCAPYTGKVKGVAVVQEVISQTLKHVENVFLKLNLLRCLKRSTAIIASSNFVKNDLIKLGIKAEKIHVIYTGVDHSYYYPRTDLDSDTVVIKPFSIKRPFFIYASSISDKEKNHTKLIDAFTEFKKRTNLSYRLVFAGSDDKNSRQVHKAIFTSPYASDIFMTGHFPHKSLSELVSCADACVFPSSIEGVGLPVLEAMSAGIPILCANAAALPEIAQDAALYFDPKNIYDMADCLERITKDTELRQKMIDLGIKKAQSFTWESNIQKTIELVESLK